MGRFLIDGTVNYFYNSDELCLEFVTIKGKIKKCDNIIRNGIKYCKYRLPLENGRVKIISYPLYYFHLKYGMGIDISEKIISFKDGDVNNLCSDNIVIDSIYNVCSEWKKISEEYMLSINGDVYNNKTLMLVNHPSNGSYFKINGEYVHRLVWKLFSKKDIKYGCIIDHIDNNIYNNRLDNLQIISQSENVKKERNRDLNRDFTFRCTYNGKDYSIYSNYGRKYSASDHEKIYNNFINICKSGKIDDYFIGGDMIKYDFLDCVWRIVHIPIECRNGIIKSDFYNLRFNSYLDAKKWIDEHCDLSKLIDKNDRFNFFKIRNEIFFCHKERNYSFNLTGGINEGFDDKVINLFLNEGKDVFIDVLPELRSERKKIVSDFKSSNRDKILTERAKKLDEIHNLKKERLEEKKKENDLRLYEFNSAPNYVFNGGVYYFSPHYNGKSYSIGNLYDKTVAIEFSDLIDSHKKDNSFNDWYESGNLLNEWNLFKERDSKLYALKAKLDSKGYKWFNPRNCWRSVFKFNGKEYILGYFKSENSCKAIYSEACKMIELGVIDKWYSDIKLHRERIKKYFE